MPEITSPTLHIGPLVATTGDFSSNLTVGGTAAITGAATLAGVTISGIVDLSGATQIIRAVTGDVTLRTTAAGTSVLLVAETAEKLRANAAGVAVTGTFSSTGAVTLSSTLAVTGQVRFAGATAAMADGGSDDLIVGQQTAGNTGITIATVNTGIGSLSFSNGTAGAALYRGYINYNHNADVMSIAVGATEVLKVRTTGLDLGTPVSSRATTDPTNALNIFNGTAPVGTLANGVTLYSTAGELRVMDAAGNATLLSPHDSETNEWVYDSLSTGRQKGKHLRVDMERLVKAINDHFGWDFVHEYTH